MKKSFVFIVLCTLMCFSAACSSDENKSDTNENSESQDQGNTDNSGDSGSKHDGSELLENHCDGGSCPNSKTEGAGNDGTQCQEGKCPDALACVELEGNADGVCIVDDRANPGDCGSESCTGSVTDACGNTYQTVYIHGLQWMAQNMRCEKGDYRYPNGDEANAGTLGLLYDWPTVAKSDFCPEGWRLPTREEYTGMLASIGSTWGQNADILRSSDWKDGKDTYGFSAVAPGNYISGEYSWFGEQGFMWSSSELIDRGTDSAWYLRVTPEFAGVLYTAGTCFFSARCVK